jgi:hypothetical protein
VGALGRREPPRGWCDVRLYERHSIETAKSTRIWAWQVGQSAGFVMNCQSRVAGCGVGIGLMRDGRDRGSSRASHFWPNQEKLKLLREA